MYFLHTTHKDLLDRHVCVRLQVVRMINSQLWPTRNLKGFSKCSEDENIICLPVFDHLLDNTQDQVFWLRKC